MAIKPEQVLEARLTKVEVPSDLTPKEKADVSRFEAAIDSMIRQKSQDSEPWPSFRFDFPFEGYHSTAVFASEYNGRSESAVKVVNTLRAIYYNAGWETSLGHEGYMYTITHMHLDPRNRRWYKKNSVL